MKDGRLAFAEHDSKMFSSVSNKLHYFLDYAHVFGNHSTWRSEYLQGNVFKEDAIASEVKRICLQSSFHSNSQSS